MIIVFGYINVVQVRQVMSVVAPGSYYTCQRLYYLLRSYCDQSCLCAG